MNNIEKITDRILADAKAEIDVINANADAEVERIQAEGRKNADKAYNTVITAGKEEANRRKKLFESSELLESRKQLLKVKQELVSEAFDKAMTDVANLPKEVYVDLVAKMIANATVDGEEKVIMSEKDKELCGADIVNAANAILKESGKTAKLTLADETKEFIGGVILSGKASEQNCTLEAAIADARQRLSAKVAAILFEA